MIHRGAFSTAVRLNEILGLLMRYGFDELLEQETAKIAHNWLMETFGREPDKVDEELSAPARARLLLQELGPTFVKFGQIAASQSSSLPEEWVEELSHLQSNVAPIEEEEVREVLESELGKPAEEVFGSFEWKELAAASIGQVHKATLPDGTPVAVKVQRPNIIPQIEEDLVIMNQAALLLERTSQTARDFGAVQAVSEFSKSLMEELSYRHEARNTEQLGKNISAYPHLRTAHIFKEFSTDRVLTMEFITGVKPTKSKELDAHGVNREELATEFARCMAQQILLDGFFHADPHPGNLSINLETQELVFLDTGMMGILDKSERWDLMQLMLSVSQQDAPALARVCINLNVRDLEIDPRFLSHDIQRLLGHINAPLAEVGAGKFYATLLQMLQEHSIQLPGGMVMALKSLIQMMEVLLALNPKMTSLEATKNVSDLLLEHYTSSETMEGFLQDRLRRVQLLAPLVDEAVESILKQARRGAVKVELRGLDLSKEVQSLSRIFRYLTIGMILGCTTIGSAVAMNAKPDSPLQFIPMLGAVGFIFSLGMSFWLLFQDARNDD
jgi:ubiquinone biosynthesis protein